MKRRDVIIGGAAAAVSATVLGAPSVHAQASFDAGKQKDAAKKWIDAEFHPSTLSKDEQMAEMEWFIDAAKPFSGMDAQYCVRDPKRP